jgi:peptide/nickel transport system substrate-binding protein
MRPMRFAAIALMLAAGSLATAAAQDAQPTHAIAMHGEPELAADFAHFPYVNPDAPKGGRIDYSVQGSFDSLNPFIVQGDGARGLFDQYFGNNVFETLLMRSRDEAFTLYPLIAESVTMDEERSFVEFTLNEQARFSDGEPITPDDVIFSMELLLEKGRPNYQNWIRAVDRMEKVGERGVRFTMREDAGREAPLLLAQLPILPKHAIDAESFDRSSLRPMIGSGPYVVETVRPGEVVVLKRNPDYWAADIPSKRGFDNFDEVRVNYIRDDNTMFEAFKRELSSIHIETDTGRWATGYDFPAFTQGRVVKEEFESGLPSGMYGFVMNTRRSVFADRAVRHALAGLFDFEWANRNLFNGAYERTRSYYDGSELSSHGMAASEQEKSLLAPFADAVLPEIMDGTWAPAVSDGSGRDREFLRRGLEALQQAGYRLDGRQLMGSDGRALTFEIMLNGPSGVPVATAWQRTLERVGIRADIRVVDSAQYLQRQRTYDYDVILQNYTSSLSPGAEQLARWGSVTRDLDGTYNFAGVAEPAIDALIEALLAARSREDFVTAVRAYDRVLLSGAYVVPLYNPQPNRWVARWDYIRHPEAAPLYGAQFPTWWREGG